MELASRSFIIEEKFISSELSDDSGADVADTGSNVWASTLRTRGSDSERVGSGDVFDKGEDIGRVGNTGEMPTGTDVAGDDTEGEASGTWASDGAEGGLLVEVSNARIFGGGMDASSLVIVLSRALVLLTFLKAWQDEHFQPIGWLLTQLLL